MENPKLERIIKSINKGKFRDKNYECNGGRSDTPLSIIGVLSSFSNQNGGGFILFGIEDGFFLGVQDIKTLESRVVNICNKMTPVIVPKFKTIQIDDKNILVAIIQSLDPTRRPCYYAPSGKINGSYVRLGSSSVLMSESEIFDYEALASDMHFDLDPVDDASVTDLLKPQINKYFASFKQDISVYNKHDLQDLLNKHHILSGNKPTLAGLLIFGKNPQAIFPDLLLKATTLPFDNELGSINNDARYLEIKHISGTLIQMLNTAIHYVKNRVLLQSAVDEETGVIYEGVPYPINALKECILNSMVHRDYSFYSSQVPIKLGVYKDRVEIESPGGLYAGLEVSKITNAQECNIRNKVIYYIMRKILRRINDNKGTINVKNYMLAANLREPEYTNVDGKFKVTLYNEIVNDLKTHN
ncbi:MAG: putative DNA binding domain-containing protein [Christensenellaceae bacterium]|jgi:ATP-dependent DNA helicase RecG|nr:putative DNA binding domain-containing protein [Christensenellaceae bacterium]